MNVKKMTGMVMIMVLVGASGMFGATKTTNTQKTSTPPAQTKKEAASPNTTASKFLASHYKPNTFAVNVGLDLWAFTYSGFGIYPGAEWTFSQYAIDNQIPFDFGVAVQGFYYTYGFDYAYVGYNYSWRYNFLGVGVFGTMHFGPKKSLPTLPEFLERVDFYAGIGLFFRTYWVNFSDPAVEQYYNTLVKPSALGFATIGGVTYFLTDTFGLRFDASYYGYGGVTLSAVFKL
ncbi:MAG: hypothetical protein N2314_02725 [Brevinematales bacterium]|nr:hypothetical protein [Brevinematales bacterium]